MQEDWGDEGGEDGESDEESEPAPSFPELTQQISSAIESLGGAVIPKLNWSSPRVRKEREEWREGGREGEREREITFHIISRMLLGYHSVTPCGVHVLLKSFSY